MQIIRGTTTFHIKENCAAAVGKFDGIHLGHQKLLQAVLQKKEEGMKTAVFTFDPPASVFFGRGDEKELTTLLEKRRLFEELGIDILIEFPLTKDTAAITAEEFLNGILKEQMHTAYIAAGTDVSFGYRGEGNAGMLKAYAKKLGFEAEIIDKVSWKGREISSTLVREEIEKGAMENAARLLGRPYHIAGIVREGEKLGRKLGIPTLNLYPEPNKCLPPFGVYYSRIKTAEKTYPGLTNIGKKPTVSRLEEVSVESYLYDFDEDLYGREIEVELLGFRRREKKFASVEELKAEIENDREAGRTFAEKIAEKS